MSILTMVMVVGGPKVPEVNHSYVFAGQDYNFITLSRAAVIEAIKRKTHEFTNIGIEGSSIVSTNGALAKYSVLNVETGKIDHITPVILNRVEVNGELYGYIIFNTAGTIQQVTVAEAVKIHNTTPFANGKLRPVQGGYIISSINGIYPLKTIELAKQKEEITVNLRFIGSAIGKGDAIAQYAGIVVGCKNGAKLNELYKRLAESNIHTIRLAKEAGADDKVDETFKITRMGVSEIYGVYRLGVVFEIIKLAENKITSADGKIIISCIDYSDGAIESCITMSKDFKLIDRKSGTEQGDKFLKAYTEGVIKSLKSLKID